jgi:glycosyltransferase involved in cell wall biosynthesis
LAEGRGVIRVSVITVTLNSGATIQENIKSVRLQRDVDVQHVFKDGLSSDNTVEILYAERKRADLKIISRSDSGIYDAMNQGVQLANGDIICFLNSDDKFVDSMVLHDVVEAFKTSKADYVYCNIAMVDSNGKTKRFWRSSSVRLGLLFSQVPHPGLFIKASVLRDHGLAFGTSYEISADLKQQLIFFHDARLKGFFLDRLVVSMALGGKSTAGLKSYARGWSESRRAFNEVFGVGGLIFATLKPVMKIFQLR